MSSSQSRKVNKRIFQTEGIAYAKSLGFLMFKAAQHGWGIENGKKMRNERQSSVESQIVDQLEDFRFSTPWMVSDLKQYKCIKSHSGTMRRKNRKEHEQKRRHQKEIITALTSENDTVSGAEGKKWTHLRRILGEKLTWCSRSGYKDDGKMMPTFRVWAIRYTERLSPENWDIGNRRDLETRDRN